MIKRITINKNRGWRGLAEVYCTDEKGNRVSSMVFSFSQEVWDDMQKGRIVIQDKDNYYVLYFNNTIALPKGQRSVLIKNFQADVVKVNSYKKDGWSREAWDKSMDDYRVINNFTNNRNNHTTSDWNYIGIRVIPSV